MEDDWEGQTGEELDRMRMYLSNSGRKLVSSEEYRKKRMENFTLPSIEDS